MTRARDRFPILVAVAVLAAVGSCKVKKPKPEGLTGGAQAGTTRGPGATVDEQPAPPIDLVVWPALPRSAEEAEALVQKRTVRPSATTEGELTAETIVRAAEAAGWESLLAGEQDVVERLQAGMDRAEREGRDAYVLWGTTHDSGGQVAAFRRLVGPGGLRGLTLVVAEQFMADGGWGGVAADEQAGDDADLDAFVLRGDRDAFAALSARHRSSDHAAWKFGYEDEVLELPVTARATQVRFAGCNMPKATQALTAQPPLGDDRLLLRLRELHCLLALSRWASPRRVAMLWGRDHIRADGFMRFLPAEAEVLAIDVFGFRHGELTTEAELATRLVVLSPVLIPLDGAGHAFALLLPDGVMGGDVDRAGDDVAATDGGGSGLRVACSVAGRMTIAGREFHVGPEDVDLPLDPDRYAFAVEAGGLRFLGALELREGTRIGLRFDPVERYVNWVEEPYGSK
ncbi:MAG: hypothetical protein HY905_06765 [Deltaproteobacteria bacterium]|nr:hypothetical protein [Deltaproteobacteria bacterium]